MTTLPEVIDSYINKFKSRLNTTVPAIITELNVEGDYIASVSAKIVNSVSYKNGETFERSEITNIPILFPSSGEGMISFPLKEGDPVLLLFFQEDTDNFIHEGTIDSTPQTYRKFTKDDVVAIPCVHPIPSSVKPHKENFEIYFNDFKLSVSPLGSTSLTTNGKTEVKTPDLSISASNRCSVESDKVYVGNGSVDIVSYLSDLTQAISEITVNGVPIDNKAVFETLKTKIEELM